MVYPPFPIFTIIGFAIHALAMLAVSMRLMSRHTSKAVTYLGIGVLAYGIDFALILTLFSLGKASSIVTSLFVFIASVIVPMGSLFLLMSVLQLVEGFKKFDWILFIFGIVLIAYLYSNTLTLVGDSFVSSYVHPAYPRAVAENQAYGGIIGAGIAALFFLYHSLNSSLFVRRRAFVIGIASVLLSASSVFWIASSPAVYIISHIVGPLGSILLAYGFFGFDNKEPASQQS